MYLDLRVRRAIVFPSPTTYPDARYQELQTQWHLAIILLCFTRNKYAKSTIYQYYAQFSHIVTERASGQPQFLDAV
jgi:hypothetical protein